MHIAEQGEGPLVLLCHGFPETWYSWRHQIPVLAEAGFHVVAPDLRGYGRTERPEEIEQYTLLHLVGDIVGLLDSLDAEKAVIVGNDWGATLAWHAAILRPDRFRGVIGLCVPMMNQPPIPPTKIFPQNEDELFYTLYFQTPGAAEMEFEHDVRSTMNSLLFAASGDAGPRNENDGTPNPFGMVSRSSGLLAQLPTPPLPSWLTEADLDIYTEAFTASGFRGGLNYYRNLDRNSELLSCFNGIKVVIPALFMTGERDVGLSIPGMKQIISEMPTLVPLLRQTIILPGCGHWIQQERPQEVNAAIISFMRNL
ncbi:alpha/beta hydrolase [Desulfosporosinus sp. FKB]|uniref:alpha/beta fold hydrolase n=1 Tax=Desulfosporosinus sp. FKB TaxID=1969835 RepID=UPI001FA8730A|nr:alpha/beta hydrolase [Desulfosporosinus sp. FKB]